MGEEESLTREVDRKGTDSSNSSILSFFSGVRVPALQHLYPIFLYSA